MRAVSIAIAIVAAGVIAVCSTQQVDSAAAHAASQEEAKAPSKKTPKKTAPNKAPATETGAQIDGRRTPRERSTTVTIGAATMAVTYGRPTRNGRLIFGDAAPGKQRPLVPFGAVWRTG